MRRVILWGQYLAHVFGEQYDQRGHVFLVKYQHPSGLVDRFFVDASEIMTF